MFISEAFAQAAPAATATDGPMGALGGLGGMLPLVLMFVVLYFVMIRPQRNRQRQAAQTQNEVMPGSRVRTTAGMYATVVSVEGDDVVLEVAPGVNVRYMRRAIMNVVPDNPGDFGADQDESVDGSGPARGTKGGTGTPSDATEDGSATT